VRAILVTCPHCGARLQVENVEVVTCEYCGTSSRVQRRTRILERVMPPPAHGPTPIAVQHVNPAARRAVWLTVLVPLGLTGMSLWLAHRNQERAERISQQVAITARTSTTTRTTSKVSGADAPEWQGTRPVIFVDVNGDGTLDFLGRSRRVRAGDEVRVIALDGATGKRLWESEPLGNYSDTYQGRLAVADDLVIYASPRAVVRGFERASGSTRWKMTLDERVKALCAGDDATIIAIGADDIARRLRRADGTTVSTEQPPAPARGRKKPACAALPSDDDVSSWDLRDDELGRRHEVSSAKRYEGPGGRVLAGQRARGTRAATLVGLDDEGAARWKILVPQDPLGSTEREPELVVVGANEACVSYYAESITKPQRIACFALTDGARRWDIEHPARSLRSLQVLGRHLVVTAVGLVEVRELATGAVVWAFGA